MFSYYLQICNEREIANTYTVAIHKLCYQVMLSLSLLNGVHMRTYVGCYVFFLK
jgi:hypothetical protein